MDQFGTLTSLLWPNANVIENKMVNEDNCFEVLNNNLSYIDDDFITENLPLILKVFSESNNNYNSDYIYSDYINNCEKIDKDKLINTAKIFFEKIDGSGELKKSFEYALENNIILLWYPEEKETILELLKNKYNITNRDTIDTSFYDRNDNFINLPLTGTIDDAICLVHEFIHYYSLEYINNGFTNAKGYLFEIISIYFETRMGDFLSNIGYSKEIIDKRLEYRKAHNFLNVNLDRIYPLLNTLSKKKKYGEITIDNIMSDEELETFRTQTLALLPDIKQFLIQNIPNISKDQVDIIINNIKLDDISIKKNICIDLASTVLGKRALEGKTYLHNFIVNIISYSLGTYFAKQERNNETDKRMLFVTNSIGQYNYSQRDTFNETDLFSVIINGIPDDYAKHDNFKIRMREILFKKNSKE